jgi:type II secretory pathway pseudopilin PulG
MKRFSMLELIAALVIASFMLGAYMSSLSHTRSRLRDLTQQQRAITVLDNTVERLAAEKSLTLGVLKDLLAHEFAAVQIPRKAELLAEVADSADRVELRITRGTRTLARMEIAK